MKPGDVVYVLGAHVSGADLEGVYKGIHKESGQLRVEIDHMIIYFMQNRVLTEDAYRIRCRELFSPS